MDAPVSGGVLGAKNATLTFMVGGEQQYFEKAQSILSLMGKTVKNCGKAGMGQTAKICNNLALGIQMRSIAEAMKLGAKMGIDSHVLKSVMEISTSSCWSLTKNNPQPGVDSSSPSSNNYIGGYACGLLRKDLDLAIKCAQEVGIEL